MIAWLSDDRTPLPATRHALREGSDAPGLLAAGGRLTVARLTEAYSQGVFPWFSRAQPVLWWAPDPRMVLPTSEFRLSRSLRRTIARFASAPGHEIRCDTALRHVIEACARVSRPGQDGTWIVPPMVDAYNAWNAVHSVESWIDGRLVGGLYGVMLGRMFFGESMFAHVTDASKIALAALVCLARAHGVPLIDCQQNTAHLASLGAREIPRRDFERHLRTHVRGEPAIRRWTYDPSMWSRLDPRLETTV